MIHIFFVSICQWPAFSIAPEIVSKLAGFDNNNYAMINVEIYEKTRNGHIGNQKRWFAVDIKIDHWIIRITNKNLILTNGADKRLQQDGFIKCKAYNLNYVNLI